MVCNVPHLMIWAPKSGRYWPAKVISIDGLTVKVRFFGEIHNRANVRMYKCLFYTKNPPGKIRNPRPYDTAYDLARKVIKTYIILLFILFVTHFLF